MSIPFKPLLDYMKARHAIYLLKESGGYAAQHLWTADPIFKTWSFCNVYRELDTVTQWINEYIRKPQADNPYLWFWLAAARQINWPPTLSALIAGSCFPTKERPKFLNEGARNIMNERRAAGLKVYTGAYMLTAHGDDGSGRSDKAHFTCNIVLKNIWEDRAKLEPLMSGSLEGVVEALRPYNGWGYFTAYEVACDLRYTRYLESAPDIMTWANPGPGAARGINRLLCRDYNLSMPRNDQINAMRDLLGSISTVWPNHWPKLEMREIEHSLCEFDKYERVRLGQGTPRAKYKGNK